ECGFSSRLSWPEQCPVGNDGFRTSNHLFPAENRESSMSRKRPAGSSPSSFVWICMTVAGLALGAAACGDDKPNPTNGTGGTGSPDGGGTGGSTGTGGTDGGATDAPADAPSDAPVGTAHKLVILHTNDLHSHLMGFAPETDYTPTDTTDSDGTVG